MKRELLIAYWFFVGVFYISAQNILSDAYLIGNNRPPIYSYHILSADPNKNPYTTDTSSYSAYFDRDGRPIEVDYYAITGYQSYKSVKINYTYNNADIKKIWIDFDQQPISSTSFFPIDESKILVTQNGINLFTNILQAIDIMGSIHWEVFNPLNSNNQYLVSLIVMSDKDHWERSFNFPEVGGNNKVDVYKVKYSLNDGTSIYEISEIQTGIEYSIISEYEHNHIANIKLIMNGKVQWERRYEYTEFDSNGNWIAMNIISSGVESSYKREIEYW